MRQQFLERSDEINTLAAAERLMPWAAHVVGVDGGYMGFESGDDFKTWLAQQ